MGKDEYKIGFKRHRVTKFLTPFNLAKNSYLDFLKTGYTHAKFCQGNMKFRETVFACHNVLR